MQCPRCQAENREGRRFCGDCGLSLALPCPSCGFVNEGSVKFCGGCGSPRVEAGAAPRPRFGPPTSYTPKHLAEKILSSQAVQEGERKTVTVMFADLKGSMELLADRDPEEARGFLDPVLERMMEAVHRYEGTVNQVMGDGIMALFGAPLAHEDHAVRACYAALRMQDSVARYAEDLRRRHGADVQIRIGLNSGEVVVRSIGSDLHMDYTAVGQTTHLAARMEQLARPGVTLMTEMTLRAVEGYVQVRSLGPTPIKGLTEAVPIYELIAAGAACTRLQASLARGLTRFVGRDAEVDQLREALEQAAGGRGQIVAVVGEPGVGKSRLFYEFMHSHRTQGWLVLESSSVSYGKATPYLPLIEFLKGYFKISERDDTRGIRAKVTGKLLTLDEALKDSIAPILWMLDSLTEDHDFLKLDPAQRRERTLDAVRRVLLRVSRTQPLLLVFEDLHWIDAETRSLLDALVESLPTASVPLAVNYRPDSHHAWRNRSYYRQLGIDTLPPETAEALLETLVGDNRELQPLLRLLIERTEGNPLFLEESVRSLVETEVLVGERGAYRLGKDPGAIQVPATVQAILAARIDRLPPEDKQLLQTASVVGKDLPWALLVEAAERPEDEVRLGLARPQAAEFVYEAKLFPDLEYTFKHALTHEVAYGSLLQDRRRAIHARLVGYAKAAALLTRNVMQLEGDLRRETFGMAGLPSVMSRVWLALTLAEQGGLDEAVAHTEDASAIAEAENHTFSLVMAHAGTGMVHLLRGDYERATGPLERGLVIDRLSDIPLLFPLVAAPLGLAYALAGRHDEGLRLLEEAIERAEAMEWVSNHAIRLVWLGRAHLLAGHVDTATRVGVRALELARRLGERGHEAYALRLLGELAGKAVPPDVERASEHYRAALSLAEVLGMRPLAAAIASSLP